MEVVKQWRRRMGELLLALPSFAGGHRPDVWNGAHVQVLRWPSGLSVPWYGARDERERREGEDISVPPRGKLSSRGSHSALVGSGFHLCSAAWCEVIHQEGAQAVSYAEHALIVSAVA